MLRSGQFKEFRSRWKVAGCALVLSMNLACAVVSSPAKPGAPSPQASVSDEGVVSTADSSLAIQARGEKLSTSRAVIPEPPLPRLPRAGGKFIDPVFGTEIMRATDERDDRVGLGTYYSHWPTFNVDNTYILIKKGLSGDALIKPFDAAAFTVGAGEKPGGIYVRGIGTISLNFESAIWHPTDPHLIYCFPPYVDGGMKLYTYNVVSKEYKLVKDFGSLGGAKDFLHQMSMSADGDVFAWSQMRVGRQDNPISYIVWRKSTDTVLYHNPTGGIVNEVRVDKSGQYLAISYNSTQPDNSRGQYLTLATGRIETIKWNSSDSPTGHGDMGTGMTAGWDNWACGINWRRLANPHSPKVMFRFTDANGNVDWTNDFHGTLLADDESWITIGTYDEPSATLPDTGVFEDEIMQVALDGSGRFRRILHTRTAIDNQTPTTGYWAMPKPTISRDGRFIAYTSNWEKSGRFDLFIARITPAPHLDTKQAAPSPASTRRRRARS